MATINTYLTFNGNCEEAFNFYKSVFKSEFSYIGRFGKMPKSDDYSVSDEDTNKIMHVSLPIVNTVLMESDTGGDWAPSFIQGNNFSVSINTNSVNEADSLFNALSNGGQVTPMNHTFWGAYFGMFTDKFGISWMVNFDENPM